MDNIREGIRQKNEQEATPLTKLSKNEKKRKVQFLQYFSNQRAFFSHWLPNPQKNKSQKSTRKRKVNKFQ